MTLAPCVMVQGSGSNVGKSVIATALCRVLREEGFRVAPFKAQNMSLNAAVTPDGREIGRAQYVQAEAAGAVPRAEMNPILLKPETDHRSQVVVLGRATTTLAAREYWGRRTELWPVVRDALRDLRRAFDVVVIEGAGSPAELNLRARDIVNMRVARAAKAAVILVGDVERGGVFAQLLGTLDLLPAAERALVRGFLVNKFRGDRSLFTDGVRILERRARIPVFGVLPYREDLGVAAEDSLSLDGGGRAAASGAPDIAVIRFPQISNFDDFEPLARAGASVRFVVDARDLGDPDLVVLPGSKATLRDLAWLRATGIAARVRAVAGAGVPVLGICGGYQMLGEVVADPEGIEGERARVRGLGLLPARTVLQRDKRTVPVSGRLCSGWALGGDTGPALTGYEIHLGVTEVEGARPFAEIVRSPSGERVTDGAVGADGRTAGTYVHGLFASEPLRVALLDALARRRGIPFTPRRLPADPYAALSAWFREAVDVPRLFAACGLA
jgi:adenosylcobyric acid synthase